MNAESCETGFHRGPIQNGGGSGPDASLGEDPDDATIGETLQGVTQGVAVGAAAIHGNAVEGGEDPLSPAVPEHFLHGKPVESPWKEAADDRGIKVADVIGSHDESPSSWHGGQLDDADFAGGGEKETAGGDHQPVKEGAKRPFRHRAA